MTSQSNIQLIPLNRLMVSDLNVRRRDRKVDIDALAASISAHGLLQNLSVIPRERDKFDVVAGGRRLAALKSLAKAGSIPKDYAVPCAVLEESDAREASLVENVHRLAMDVMDEVDAFAALVAEGLRADEIARRFGVTRKHVDQRLALASLSPLIKAAWKRGDINLDCARAFCMVEDHAQQNAVFRSVGKPVTDPRAVRARLMDGRVRASDRLAVFVGLDGYEAAGGAVVRDLFDAEAIFLGDPALLTRLAEDKLEAVRTGWLAQGWGWVDLNLGGSRPEGLSSMRLYPEWRDPTPEETAELDRLEAAIDELDAALEANGVENDLRWSTRDDLEAEYETIRQAARIWRPDLLSHAGVILSIDHDGAVAATCGLVRVADEKAIKVLRRSADHDEDNTGGDNRSERDDLSGPANGLPKQLIRELSVARTRAIRLHVAQNAHIALAIAVAGMLVRTTYRAALAGIDVAADAARIEDLGELHSLREIVLFGLPDDDGQVLQWALKQSADRLLSILAVLVAGAIDLTHERGAEADQLRQATSDLLAQTLNIDMRRHWSADAEFFGRLPKADLLAALGNAPSFEKLSAKQRDASLSACAKLKKLELITKVSAELEGTGYLPDLLITEPAAGALSLTEAAEAEIAA